MHPGQHPLPLEGGRWRSPEDHEVVNRDDQGVEQHQDQQDHQGCLLRWIVGGLTTTGAAVTGRVGAKADDGRRGTSDKGIKLICRADAAGKNRVAGGLIGLLLPDGAGRLIRPAGGRAIGTS